MTLKEEQIQEIQKVEEAVCKVFDVEIKDVYDKTSRRQESLARSFLYYILHADMNISVGCISKRYGRKSNAIFKSLSKTKYRVKIMHSYKEMYLCICNNKKMI